MKLLCVFGTRPEAIKMAPVILEARRHAGNGVTPIVVSTGQHREMLRPILSLFGIVPDIDLDLMQPNQTLDSLAARALTALGEVIAEQKPDAVIVQGDTTTAMCGALAAFHARVPVAHVEAGLRTNDIYSPFPEEVNRRIIGQVARWHLAPTAGARENLRRENLPPAAMRDAGIWVTGNTGIDALRLAVERVAQCHTPNPSVADALTWKTGGSNRQLVLVTGHRRENFGAPFEEFCRGLLDIADAHPNALVYYPVHLNPNVQQPVRALMSGHPNVVLAPVADYPDFVLLMKNADLIVTDSGGVQEEAPSLGIPVLVTRNTTERPEAVDAGGVLMVGPNRERLYCEAHRLLSGDDAYRASMSIPRSPYGDGHAAERCLAILQNESAQEFEG